MGWVGLSWVLYHPISLIDLNVTICVLLSLWDLLLLFEFVICYVLLLLLFTFMLSHVFDYMSSTHV